MRKNYSLYCLLLLSLSFISLKGSAQKQINMDFGPSDRTTAGWNNVTNPKTGNIANLNDTDGTATGYAFELTVPFTNDWNLVGTTTPDPALNLPSSATSDTFFGNSKGAPHKGEITPQVVLTLKNLDVNTSYSFTFFASRMSVTDNREALYTVEGKSTKTATLNATANTSNVAIVTNVVPKADGTIALLLEPGPNNKNGQGFFYLGALLINYTPGTILSVTPDIAAGNIKVFPNPAAGKVVISTGGGSRVENIQVLSAAGVKVLEETKIGGSINNLDVSGLVNGLYYMNIKTTKGHFHTKLVVNN